MRRVRVDVWWGDLTAADISAADGLPAAERERLAELAQPADRGRRLLGAALLQAAVRYHRGLPSTATVAVDRRCSDCGRPHGRPTVADGRGPHVSVSHAGVYAVVATCAEAPVGVDVELVGDDADAARRWVAGESVVKTGAAQDRPAGHTVEELSAPHPAYVAALAVAALDAELEIVPHPLASLRGSAPKASSGGASTD